MNKKFIIPAILSLVIIAGCATQEEKTMPYPFETAVMKSKIEGTVTGTMDTYIKGDKTLIETHAKSNVEGAENSMDTIYIDTGKQVSIIDLNAKSAIQSENPIYEKLQTMSKEERLEFLTNIILAVPEGGNRDEYATKKGEKEIAGQTCENYLLEGIGEVCIWNAIPIYSSTIPMDENDPGNKIEATSIETGVSIPDSKFEVPEGIKIN